MNSPNNNNNNLYLFKKKLYLLLYSTLMCIGISSFSQDEINPNGHNSFYYEMENWLAKDILKMDNLKDFGNLIT